MEELKQLEQMKQSLMCCVQPQIMGHLDQVDSKELGEAVDMIKDLSEAIYYCTITEAMKEDEKGDKKHKEEMYYRNNMMYPTMQYYPRTYAMYDDPRMYYNGRGSDTSNGNTGNESRSGNSGNNQSGNRGYQEPIRHDQYMMQDPTMMRDHREGRSGMRRKTYMEGKQYHHDKVKQMQELEAYMHELSSDITEMIQDATPEEKQMLQQKISALATKIK